MIGLLLGISYGWYAYANAETNINIVTKKEAPTVMFAQTEFISATINTPIYDDDRYRYANKNSFTVTVGENLRDYEVGLEIILNDIEISDELRIENYKYELLENKKVIASGNFNELTDTNKIDLLPMTIMNLTSYPTINVYEFYVWLSEDGTEQNNLMNKKFGAKINVNSAVKK